MFGIGDKSEANAVKTPSLHLTIYTHELVERLYCAMTISMTVPWIRARSPWVDFGCAVVEESSRSICCVGVGDSIGECFGGGMVTWLDGGLIWLCQSVAVEDGTLCEGNLKIKFV